MHAEDLQLYKRSLLKKRRELTAAKKEAGALVPGASVLSGDAVDRANADSEAEIQICLHQTDVRLLRAIEDAIARIEQHTYGICQACGGPITKARLKVVPWTRHCLGCKESEHSTA